MAIKDRTSTDMQAMDFTNQSVAFDVEAFNTAIIAHGVTLVHWQAMPNPVGLIDKYDNRRPNLTNNNNVFNGFYYKKVGALKATISNNTKEAKASTGGLVDAGVAQLTAHTFYLDDNGDISNKRVYLSPFDRFYLDQTDILAPRGELVEASITGTDTLNFPVEQVLSIVDADGIEYTSDCYQIIDGTIKWGNKRPSFDIEVNKGKIYSIKYLLRPFYYVDRLLHEIRLAQVEDPYTGDRKFVPINQSCIINREYIFQNKSKNPEDPNQKDAISSPRE